MTSPVLDAGCGIGVTSRELARRGHDVTGIDASRTAIEQARTDADRDGVQVDFAVADLTRLTGYDGSSTVIDSAAFHAIEADLRPSYVAALARACRPGAVLHVLVFTGEIPTPDPNTGINGVTEYQLRQLVEPSFLIDTVETATIAARAPEHVAPELDRDTAGRVLLPAFRMTARRR